MKTRFWPEARAGKWAAGLTLAFVIIFVIKMMFRLPLPTPLIAVLGIAGFIMGIISIIKNKDRAVMTLLSIPVGAFIILVTVTEIAVPH